MSKFLKFPFNKHVPMVYDDSMSLYEWINKVVEGINEFVMSLDANVEAKLDKEVYEEEKTTFEKKANKVDTISVDTSGEQYPNTNAVIDYVEGTAVKFTDLITNLDTASNFNVFTSQFVKDSFIQKNGTYSELNTNAKTILEAINECASLIPNPNQLIINYGEGEFNTITTALVQHRTVVVKKNKEDGVYYYTFAETAENEYIFSSVTDKYNVVSVKSDNTWSEQTIEPMLADRIVTEVSEESSDSLVYSTGAINESINSVNTRIDNHITNARAWVARTVTSMFEIGQYITIDPNSSLLDNVSLKLAKIDFTFQNVPVPSIFEEVVLCKASAYYKPRAYSEKVFYAAGGMNKLRMYLNGDITIQRVSPVVSSTYDFISVNEIYPVAGN